MYILQLRRKDNPDITEAVLRADRIQDLILFLDKHIVQPLGENTAQAELAPPLSEYHLPEDGDYLANQTVLILTSLDARIAEAQDNAREEVEAAWDELLNNTHDVTRHRSSLKWPT